MRSPASFETSVGDDCSCQRRRRRRMRRRRLRLAANGVRLFVVRMVIAHSYLKLKDKHFKS